MTDECMTDEEYRVKLREDIGYDVEVDEDAEVSRAHDHPPGETCGSADEDGAYVQAWIWVPADD